MWTRILSVKNHISQIFFYSTGEMLHELLPVDRQMKPRKSQKLSIARLIMRFTRRKSMTDVQIVIFGKICPDFGIRWIHRWYDVGFHFWCSMLTKKSSKSKLVDVKLMVPSKFGFWCQERSRKTNFDT